MDEKDSANLNDNPKHQRFFSKDLGEYLWYGYPLPNPEPDIGVDGKPVARVEIGDIGYISDDGKFIRLFNAHLEPGVDGQPGLNDLPIGFVPTPPNLRMRHWTSRNTYMYAHVPEAPETWEEKVRGWGRRLARPIIGERPLEWRPKAPGSVLSVHYDYMLPTVKCEDALNTLHYVAYAQKHAKSWHEFVSRRFGLELEDLIFITGIDRSATWVTMVHDGKEISALDFGPKAPYPDEKSLGEAESFWREYMQAVLEQCCVKPKKSEDGETYRRSELPESNGRLRASGYDQALFLRYVRAKRRDPKDTVSHTSIRSNAGTSSECLLEKSEYAADKFTRHTGRERFTDSLEPALDYILKYSDAEIAVAHSRQLFRLPGSFWEKCLDAWLMVEDGVGVLSSERTPGARRLPLAQVFTEIFWDRHPIPQV